MNYPIWEIPYLGGGWIIGLIATIHVFIAQFAVGAGLFLPMMERHARLRGDAPMREWLHSHLKFFVVLTSAVSASLGVGIWFAISLVHARGTATLIRIFVQLWAIEWVFFLVEVIALAFYYYTWDKVRSATHEKIGWIYSASSFGSLIVINGILSCMLTSGTLPETGNPWDGFFNATFWPTTILRICVSLALAGIWAFWSSATLEDDELKTRIMRYASLWVLPAFVLMPPVGFWAFQALPEGARALLEGGTAGMASGTNSILTRVAMILIMTTVTISVIVYIGPFMNARSFSRGLAAGLLSIAFLATMSTEWVREVLRKPFVLRDVVYSSGVRVDEVSKQATEGHLANAVWARAWRDLEPETPARTGQAIFRSQCMSCHTIGGYRAMSKLLAGRNEEAIGAFLDLLAETDPKKNTYLRFMPPLAGTAEERKALAAYLATLSGPAEH
jgi:cytochrome bd ubiquinol oxidase subunit I